MKILNVLPPAVPYYLVRLRPKDFLSTLLPNTLRRRSSLIVRGQVLHLRKNCNVELENK